MWSSTWAVVSLCMSSFNLKARCELTSSGVWHCIQTLHCRCLRLRSIHLYQLVLMSVIIAQWRRKSFTILDLLNLSCHVMHRIAGCQESSSIETGICLLDFGNRNYCILQYTPSPKKAGWSLGSTSLKVLHSFDWISRTWEERKDRLQPMNIWTSKESIYK